MDAALGLGGGHALHAVPAGLELQARVGALAHDAGDHLLEAAGVARALGDELDLPAVPFREARVHAEEVAREEGALVAAGAGADLQEEVLVVVGVLRQQHLLDVGADRLEGGAPGLDLGLGELAHLGVPRHLLGRGDVGLGGGVLAVAGHHGGDLRVLLGEPAVVVEVRGDAGIGEEGVQLPRARHQARELRGDAGLHGSPVSSRPLPSSGKSVSTARTSASRPASAARFRACVGWCRILFTRPAARPSRTFAGSSPRARRAFALASSAARYSSALVRSCTMAGTALLALSQAWKASTCRSTIVSASATAAWRWPAPSCTIVPRSSMV